MTFKNLPVIILSIFLLLFAACSKQTHADQEAETVDAQAVNSQANIQLSEPTNQVQTQNTIQVEQVVSQAEENAPSVQFKKIKSNDNYESPKAVPVLEELSSVQEMLNLAQYKGKVVYLDFWASWCAPCQETFPWMQKMQEKYPDDLVIVAVNLDESKGNAERFLADKDVNFKIIYDQLWQAGREYEIFGLPYSFVYNREGELVGKHGGFAPGDEINLEAALNNLFATGE